ncbi:MAG: hypothetical protein NC177_11430 [Ruminococcus flavefaciens]|nr:hypothetical protein [Ruminococcus flavefaciens]
MDYAYCIKEALDEPSYIGVFRAFLLERRWILMNLELLNENNELYSDECMPKCLPAEENLNKDLKNAKIKTSEELEEQWAEEDEEMQLESKDYIEYSKNIKSDLLNNDYYAEDDEYSLGEEIPDCNPWRD